MLNIQTIKVQEPLNSRLDKYLASRFPDVPRRFFQLQIQQGTILVNEKKVSPSHKIKLNDEIKITAAYSPTSISLEPQTDIQFETIFQNDDFAIINKPAGLTVHPSATQKNDTLVNGLLNVFPKLKEVGEDPTRPGIVHRLDKDTSGLMIIALNQKSFEYFKNLFKQHQVKKNYQALVWGQLTPIESTIQSFIGRSKKNPLRQASSADPAEVSNAKEAITKYKVLSYMNDKTLIEALPQTGRRHQIRVHLASLGHPLVGDQKYARRSHKALNLPYPRHLLHAVGLEFVGPDSQPYKFGANLPLEFRAVLNQL